MVGRKKTVSDDNILRFVRDHDDPVVTTGEVQEHLGFSSSAGTLKRLHPLAEEGLLDCKKSGIVPMWWITDQGRAYLDDAERDS